MTQPNSTGTVWSAQRWQNTCALIKKLRIDFLGLLRIHEESTRTFPKMNNQAIQVRSTCTQWIRTFGITMSGVGLTTGRNPSQQTTAT